MTTPPVKALDEGALKRMQRALANLHATVWGECPSLLNEDSGGDAGLDIEIRELLALDIDDRSPSSRFDGAESIERAARLIFDAYAFRGEGFESDLWETAREEVRTKCRDLASNILGGRYV